MILKRTIVLSIIEREEDESLRSILFSLNKSQLACREHSYVVDAWFGCKGSPDMEGNACVLEREQAQMGLITGETTVGYKKARKAIERMVETGVLTSAGDRFYVDLPREAPYVRVPVGTAREMCRGLTEDQFKIYLQCKQRKQMATAKGEQCEVAPIWLMRDQGLRDANTTRDRVVRNLGEIEALGLIKTRPTLGKNTFILEEVAEEWKRPL